MRFGRRRPPLVSVVVPVYDVEEYLPACLDSALAQTHRTLEVVVVDDGSPDASGEHRRGLRGPGRRGCGSCTPTTAGWARPATRGCGT